MLLQGLRADEGPHQLADVVQDLFVRDVYPEVGGILLSEVLNRYCIKNSTENCGTCIEHLSFIGFIKKYEHVKKINHISYLV